MKPKSWNYKNLKKFKINQKHKNIKLNPTLHIILIKVNKNIDICINILLNTSHNK